MQKMFTKKSIVRFVTLMLVLCMSFCMISCSDSNNDDFFDDEELVEKTKRPVATPDSENGTSIENDDNKDPFDIINGDDSDNKSDNESNVHQGEVANRIEIEGAITLTYPQDVYASDAGRASIRQWISYFNTLYPDVKVKEDFSDRANWSARLSAKDMGDVFWLDDSQIYDMAVTNESLMPLDQYVELFGKDELFGLNMSDVYAGFYNLGEVEGRLYMIAASCGQQTFTYNKGMLMQAGLEMPSDDWTWAHFKDYVGKLTVSNSDGSLAQVGAAMNITISPMYVPFYLGFGGQWCDTVNKKINLTTDANVLKGVEELVDILQKKYIYPTSAGIMFGGDYATAFANINADNVISTAAFLQLDSFVNLATRAKMYESHGIDWDIVSFPLFEYPASPCGAFGYGVFNYTQNPDAAAALCLSLYTQGGQKAINQGAGGGVPLLSSFKNDTFWHLKEYPDKNFNAFVARTDMYVPAQLTCDVPNAVGTIIREGMDQLFRDLYEGSVSVEDSLATIETRANEKWSTLK